MLKRNLHRFLYLPPPLAVHIPGNTRRSSVISRKVYNFLHINSSYNTRNGCVGTWLCLLVCLMAFNATFNNISVISWRSVLLVEETGENHRPVTSQWQTLSLMMYTTWLSRVGVMWRNREVISMQTFYFTKQVHDYAWMDDYSTEQWIEMHVEIDMNNCVGFCT